MIIWAGAAVVWMSKRHPQTPGSVSEAEYCAMYYAWKWTKWIREVLIDMGLGEYVKRPTLMFGDNRNARDWATVVGCSDTRTHVSSLSGDEFSVGGPLIQAAMSCY